jgi:hypothetical protein
MFPNFRVVEYSLFSFKILFINIYNKINYNIKYNFGKPVE